jgi:hypothetical protein
MGSYVGNMAVTCARVFSRVMAQNRIIGWWDCDFDRRTEAFTESLIRWLAIIGTIRQEYVNGGVDLIQ